MNEKDIEYKWYPLYTKSRHEKTAYANLKEAGYEVYLPLQKKQKKWKDRKKIVEVPLISSYVFVRIKPYQLYKVLDTRGISRYIQFAGRPATVRDEEIEIMQKALEQKTEIEVIDGVIKEGTPVRLTSGIFNNYQGKVIESKGKNKLVIQIESMHKSMLITVDKNNLVKTSIT